MTMKLKWHKTQVLYSLYVPAWAKVQPDIPFSIYVRVLNSNPRFLNTEKLSEGEETHVSQTRDSEFSGYQVMVNSHSVLSWNNTSIV